MKIPARLRQTVSTSQGSGLLAALLILISGTLIHVFSYTQLHQQLSQQQQHDIEQQLQRLATALAPALLREDRISLNLTLSDWQHSRGIESIRVLNPDQQLIAEIGRSRGKADSLRQIITRDDRVLGHLHANINHQHAHQTARRYLSLGLMATAFLAVLAGLAIYQLTDYLLRYVAHLSQALDQWDEHNPAALPSKPLLPELQQLHRSIRRLTTQQEHKLQLKSALNQFTSHRSANSNAHYQHCAMLYIELSNLAELQRSLTAEALSEQLNSTYAQLNQAAKLYNGKLDRYLGDGIVLIFGLSHSSPQSALHCLHAAQLFLGLHKAQIPHALTFRIAAHWGPVLMTATHDEQELQSNLIGDSLHWAARLAAHNDSGDIVASAPLKACLDPSLTIHWQTGPCIDDWHGIQQRSFRLTALSDKTEALIQRQIKHIQAITENA